MSVSSNFNTADRIIRNAMQNAKLLEKGSDPDPEDYADYMNRLNDIINLEQTQGLKLWLNTMVDVPLVPGTGRYVFGATGSKVLRILEAYYVYVNGASHPLNLAARKDYNLLSSKSSPGIPNTYFVDYQQDTRVMTLWPVPDVVASMGKVQVLQQTSVTNLIKLDDTMNFPTEWFIFLHWALADDISGGQSEQTQVRCANKANAYRQVLQDWDVEEASTSFAPSGRYW